MANFLIYDLVLLGLFILFVSIFLYRNRTNLKKDGLLYLYRTQWGTKLIERVGKKYRKTLKVLSYVCIWTGYILMGWMVWFFGKLVWVYAKFPDVVRDIGIPPIMPLVPYIDKIVPSETLQLPAFYFIYWVVILAIIAIPHEFAHGIFMRRYGVKIKSTGFGFFPFFLPIFLAAFVEQDEKSLNSSSKFQQKAILAAGTFANLVTAILAFIIMALFFSLSFSPAGASFSDYAYANVPLAGITMVNNVSVNNVSVERMAELLDDEENEIVAGNYTFSNIKGPTRDPNILQLYFDAPAINSRLGKNIIEINGIKILDSEVLRKELAKYSPGDELEFKTINKEEETTTNIVLSEYPTSPEDPWLGIVFENNQRKGSIGKVINALSFKDSSTYYEAKYGLAEFIYDFLWWLALISFSVALINMLPMGIFDGGRFFYLTMWQLTGSEKAGKKLFKGITYFLLFLLLLLMVFWATSFIG